MFKRNKLRDPRIGDIITDPFWCEEMYFNGKRWRSCEVENEDGTIDVVEGIRIINDPNLLTGNDVKQVLVIRKDLKMRKGKCVSQGAHASFKACISDAKLSKDGRYIQIPADDILTTWLNESFTKITLSVDSLEELEKLADQAAEMKLRHHVVTDEGRTEFNGQRTVTALAIGPGLITDIDQITKGLSLL